MLSMINILKDYKDNKKRYLNTLRELDKKDLQKLYKEVWQYEQTILSKYTHKETLITMIDLSLNRLIFNEHVLNVAPELKYKGKYPEKYKKNISKIAEQLDINEGC